MKKALLIIFLILILSKVYPQGNGAPPAGVLTEANLKAIGNLTPYSTGGVGFDNRYEGIKGSPRLFDNLLPSLIKVEGQISFLQLESNMDLMNNSLLFNYPKTNKLVSIPSGIVNEVRIISEGKELVFRVTRGKDFEKDIKDGKFYQVLKEGQYEFIKLPIKRFVPADYKKAYSPDRRYDEYTTDYWYYLKGSDSIFHQIKLTKKSLVKFFPDKKESISRTIDGRSYPDDEEMVLDILNQIEIKQTLQEP
jgi:hypothetical protein